MEIKKYTYFIGTDVSKNKLDHAVMQGNVFLFHQETTNDIIGTTSFIKKLKSLKGFTIRKTLFCMEDTGIYCNHLLNFLHKVKANVVLEPASKIRNSMGNIRNKNDKVDAIRIAEYAYQFKDRLKLREPRRPVVIQLAELIALRERLRGLSSALNVPLNEQRVFLKHGGLKTSGMLCSRSILALKEDITDVDAHIDRLINEDECLQHLVTLITSVKSIGKVTALNIVVSTNEFKDIQNPKKFACYAGVAPFIRESGKYKGRATVSHMANKKMKSLLHMCAMVAKSYEPDLREYYARKTKIEGKNGMAVLNAIRYKLILRVFACVNQDRLYQPTYQR